MWIKSCPSSPSSSVVVPTWAYKPHILHSSAPCPTTPSTFTPSSHTGLLFWSLNMTTLSLLWVFAPAASCLKCSSPVLFFRRIFLFSFKCQFKWDLFREPSLTVLSAVATPNPVLHHHITISWELSSQLSSPWLFCVVMLIAQRGGPT